MHSLPCWEAQFERTSSGFRPGRCTHDAAEKIFRSIRPQGKKKWVLDADIRGCFDNINHEYLLKQIGNFPARKLIKHWLKAGYVDNNTFHPTEAGTPQGGCISPLLANIALHGMETAVGVKYDYRGDSRGKRIVVRYADDFLILCETKEDAKEAKKEISQWLSVRGLSLSEEKTKIVHVTEGFDFLGWNFRHYKVSTKKTGYKLLIKPSKESVRAIKLRLKEVWLKNRGREVGAVIKEINPIIRGWANYHRKMVASETFKNLDSWMYWREQRYAKHKHPNKNSTWRKNKYFGRFDLKRGDNWVFGKKETGAYINKFSWFKIERHRLIPGLHCPDDPNPEVQQWFREKGARQSRDKNESWQKIAKNQKYVCPVCNESLFNGELTHVHHKIPKSMGGRDTYSNLVHVHLMCHQQIHHDTLL
ncbi:reverse transcriptase domain-containing protein [Okeania sp. SIO2C9]|uniref:group II intron reverse transcriptase n=1 Tax=Okeania sp. SIO2C9 TaxID=2607791 RepID=UPI0025F0A9D8|nr:reverse transcriptase domain-containing protein [Okeania sp. SIO2C9]